MLESLVSVLPSDWFSLSGWPGFRKRTVFHVNFNICCEVFHLWLLERLVDSLKFTTILSLKLSQLRFCCKLFVSPKVNSQTRRKQVFHIIKKITISSVVIEKKLLFSTNSHAKLLSVSLLLDNSISQSHSRL